MNLLKLSEDNNVKAPSSVGMLPLRLLPSAFGNKMGESSLSDEETHIT